MPGAFNAAPSADLVAHQRYFQSLSSLVAFIFTAISDGRTRASPDVWSAILKLHLYLPLNGDTILLLYYFHFAAQMDIYDELRISICPRDCERATRHDQVQFALLKHAIKAAGFKYE